MASQTLDQSNGEKVCGPDWIDKSIKKNKGKAGLIEKISSQQVSAQDKIESTISMENIYTCTIK